MITPAMSETQKTVLHVGCGANRLAQLPKYFHGHREIRLDLDPGVKPDIVASITDMKPVDSASVDAVFSSHNLEHVFLHEISLALAEFRRVLKPGGVCMVLVPDIQQAAALVAQGKLHDTLYQSPAGPITPFDMIFGHAASVRNYPLMAHKSGFTSKSLQQAMLAHFPHVVTATDTRHNVIGIGFADTLKSEEGIERFKTVTGAREVAKA